MATAAMASTDWPQRLRDLVDRNATLELTPSDTDGPAVTWKLRLLGLDEQALVVEKPATAGDAVKLSPRMLLSGAVVDGTQRWTFDTQLIEQTLFDLNATNRIPALRLARPARAKGGQRRQSFRVGLHPDDAPDVKLWRLLDLASCLPAERHNDAQLRRRGGKITALTTADRPQLGPAFDATVVDLSAGGVALLLPRDIESILGDAAFFWLQLALPDGDVPLLGVIRPAQWRKEPAAPGRVRVGFCFTFDHNPEHAAVFGDQMSRLAAHYQRLMLQRRK